MAKQIKQVNNNAPRNVVAIGECMLELTQHDQHTFKRGFAGDTFNTCVYMKRLFGSHNVQFMTCVGKDSLSDNFLTLLRDEHLSQELVCFDEKNTMGAYMVNTDEHGERSFIYWRGQSAAKQLMNNLTEAKKTRLLASDLVFFSGISLAILPPTDRQMLLDLLQELKQTGCKLAFDPNYRPALWESEDAAKSATVKAFEIADIILPGIEDFALFGLKDSEQIATYIKRFGFDYLVLKDGANTVAVYTPTEQYNVPVQPNPNVVDTTSAGDAFAGVFLGSLVAGNSVVEAVKLANTVAKEVTCHKGAIVDKTKFEQFLLQLTP